MKIDLKNEIHNLKLQSILIQNKMVKDFSIDEMLEEIVKDLIFQLFKKWI